MGKKKKKNNTNEIKPNNTILAASDKKEEISSDETNVSENKTEIKTENKEKIIKEIKEESNKEKEETKKIEEKEINSKNKNSSKNSNDDVSDKTNNDKEIIATENNNLIPKQEKKSYIKFIIIPCIIFFILFFVFLFSTIFALINSANPNIINGIYIENIEISNLNKEEALEKIKTEYEKRLATIITLKHNESETLFSLNQISLSYDLDNVTNEAYTVGRSGNLILDNFEILKCLFNKKTFKPDLIIKEHKRSVLCLTQLSSGILASCSLDQTIK